ncbi:ClpP/crotonase [Penicillium riverlandense]|uniref:ClpP/crotonase n=1 Tax=Penicillium riverlandense TaxID=1903569 RepID=UPI0025495CE4|nr:ClpP/crotonase [Penicillium riverlandense]KAJ5833056.1 ClpP/crotonase [Penicillium riverlandense]
MPAPAPGPNNRPAPLPSDYSDITSQLDQIRSIASTPDPNLRGYIRQRGLENFGVAGTTEWRRLAETREEVVKFTPSNNVQGFARIEGRRVVLTADDFTLRAGHADGALMDKTVYMEKLSHSLQLPIIKLTDGSSGGGSVTTIKSEGWSYVPPMHYLQPVIKQLNQGIPNLGACLGPAIGFGAARLVACHFTVMAGDIGSLFSAGPQIVAGATFEEGLTKETLGGPAIHCTNGTIDNLAANEAGCFEQIKTVLGYLPNSGAHLPPVTPCSDPCSRISSELRSIIPRRRERMYNPRRIIKAVVDKESWFEIGALWGTTTIVGLARFDGRPVGIIASNCEVNAGAIDALGAQKVTRHLKFCDIFNLPIVQFVDVPGYAIGTAAERSAVMRYGVQLGTTYFATTVPIFNVILRKVYGVAGGLMVDSRDPRMRVAWPSGEWGSVPLDGGIEVAHRHELSETERKQGKDARDQQYRELDQDYRLLMNPVRTANAFNIEEIIDPALTRPLLCEWLGHIYEDLLPIRVAERVCGKLVPSWT